MTNPVPVSDIDIFSDEVATDPYPYYQKLRALGPLVYFDKYDLYGVTQFSAVREMLKNWDRFTSEQGVAFNEIVDQYFVQARTVLTVPPPEHTQLRSTILERMSPRSVRDSFATDINAKVDEFVGDLVRRSSFDFVTDLAEPLVENLISEIVGFPESLGSQIREGAAAMFLAMDNLEVRGRDSVPVFEAMLGIVAGMSKNDLVPGSCGHSLFEAAERGEIPAEFCGMLILNYAGPAYDTTVGAISNLAALFARHPEQWDLVLDDPDLVVAAREEGLRCEAPFQMFKRVAMEGATLGGVPVPAGARLAALVGCANRDEQRHEDPETFNVLRAAKDHISFGFGIHNCLGAPLARLEVEAVFRSLAKRGVRWTQSDDPVRTVSSVTRGYAHLPVTVTSRD